MQNRQRQYDPDELELDVSDQGNPAGQDEYSTSRSACPEPLPLSHASTLIAESDISTDESTGNALCLESCDSPSQSTTAWENSSGNSKSRGSGARAILAYGARGTKGV
ncbi:hypothetical protein OF83DRAFT_1111241 [Amylostereum chailletii]|nr:hypothetical protein OF83DRAFT_1111241 [Amylostereum chailletii]